MPIILLWNEAAGPFGPQVGRWLDEIARSTLFLGKWLEKRLDEARRLDRLSAAFPVFRFHNTALTARIAQAQFGSLLTQPVASVGAHAERALGQWDIARDVKNQARSAALPVEALRVLEEMTTGVLASLERFGKPSEAMFDPKARTAADLIGLAALAYRTVGAHRDGLLDAAKRLKAAFAPPGQRRREPRRSGPRAGGPVAPPEPDLPLAMQLDTLTRYVVGAILVIPALSQLLRRIGGDALVALRYGLLDKFQHFEALAHGYRRRLFVELTDVLDAFAEATLQFLTRLSGFAVDLIGGYARIGTAYLAGLVAGVTGFAKQFETFWKGVTQLIDKVVGFATAVSAIDIGDVVHKGLLTAQEAIKLIDDYLYPKKKKPKFYKAPPKFPVKISEIVLEEGAGVRANNEIRSAIAHVLAAIQGSGDVWWIDPIAGKASGGKFRLRVVMLALGWVHEVLKLPRAPLAAQPLLKVDVKGAPDLGALVVVPLGKGLDKAVAAAGTGAQTAVGAVFTTAGTTLADVAATFDKAAADAAGTSPARLVRRLTGDVDAPMQLLFGDQEKTARPTGLEPTADAFAGWLLQGGFDTIGAVTAGYVRFVLDEWLAHVAGNTDTPAPVTPTSPRQLRKRAVLGRVHLPQLRISARRMPLGRPLANRVATEFRDAVEAAYRTGLGRLDTARAAP